MFLSEGVAGIISLYSGAAIILEDPLLFGASTGSPGAFTGSFSLTSFGGTTVNGVACAIEQAIYGDFISEFSSILNTVSSTINAIAGYFGEEFGCPLPSGAPAFEAAASSYPGYPKPSPCTLNKMQNGYNQCAPDTNTYARFNTKQQPFCENSPVVASPLSNPLPAPGGI